MNIAELKLKPIDERSVEGIRHKGRCDGYRDVHAKEIRRKHCDNDLCSHCGGEGNEQTQGQPTRQTAFIHLPQVGAKKPLTQGAV